VAVSGPRGGQVRAPVGFVDRKNIPAAAARRIPVGERIAIVDLPSASGIELLPPAERNPWVTTTFGTGELLRHAAASRADAILLGVGGSATNDLGLGALAALGLHCDRTGGTPLLPPVPGRWTEITQLSGDVELPPVYIACDVTNPLLGPRGATVTFGPQKGLAAGDVRRLESQVARMALMLCHHFNKPDSLMDAAGTGAAGGIAFGLMTACDAKLVPGFDLVSDWLDLPARIAAADVVITGEGRFDATSLGGKGPGSLFAGARRLGKRALVFTGSLGVEPDEGLHAITPAGLPLAAALPRTAEFLAAAISRNL